MYTTRLVRGKHYPALSFRMFVTNEPRIVSTLKPKLGTTEFAVYGLGIFGIWFGLSFFTLIAIEIWIESLCSKKA